MENKNINPKLESFAFSELIEQGMIDVVHWRDYKIWVHYKFCKSKGYSYDMTMFELQEKYFIGTKAIEKILNKMRNKYDRPRSN